MKFITQLTVTAQQIVFYTKMLFDEDFSGIIIAFAVTTQGHQCSKLISLVKIKNVHSTKSEPVSPCCNQVGNTTSTRFDNSRVHFQC